MNCPICGKKMEEGGIIANGIAMWHPLREFEKKGLKKLYYKDGKALGSHSILLRECKIPNAWYCASCNKVAGIFDINDAE